MNQRRGGRERKPANRESVQSILRNASEDKLCTVNEDISDENLVDSIVIGNKVNGSDMAEEKEAGTQIDDEYVSNNVCKLLIYTLYFCIYFKHHVFTCFVTHLYTQYRQVKIHSQGLGLSKHPYFSQMKNILVKMTMETLLPRS